MVALAGDDAELGEARALAVRDGLLDLLDCLLDIQAVKVDRAVWLLLVVLWVSAIILSGAFHLASPGWHY